jgi:hypothetical protein
MVDGNSYIPRVNYRFCHELSHIILGHQLNKIVTEDAEKEADQFASELMLPSSEFRQLMTKFELHQLKEHYNHVSWEAIGRKWAELRPAVLTIFDNGMFKYRGGPARLNFPSQITQDELNVVNFCFDNCCNYRLEVSNLNIHGYYVDEGRNFERVLILTEVNDII